MSSSAAIHPITVDQYLSFKAPSGFRDELIEGKIILSHVIRSTACWNKPALEGTEFVARRRTNMRMPQDFSMPSPDVFGIDADRWCAAITEDGYPQQSPQLVVEVISRSNTTKNVDRKTALYLKNGASEVWIVYPNKRKGRGCASPGKTGTR
jgi:hypothetical protein